MSKRFFRWRFM